MLTDPDVFSNQNLSDEDKMCHDVEVTGITVRPLWINHPCGPRNDQFSWLDAQNVSLDLITAVAEEESKQKVFG